MRRTRESHEASDQQAGKAPEKKIKSFDDLKTTGGSDRIDTFDNLKGKQSSDKTIRTFDDLKSTTGAEEKRKIESSESATAGNIESAKAPNVEQQRLAQAADRIKKNDWIQPEKWKTLKDNEKITALEHTGRELGQTYHTPDPPIFTEKASKEKLGSFGDGYRYDAKTDKMKGSDYRITLNEEGAAERNKRLFGDDPRAALETHSHEFRHSYQHEQAHAFEKGFMTDDPGTAKAWSENINNYKVAPEKELAKTDPDKYSKEYEAYWNQPVEKDARKFSGDLTSRIYGDKNVREEIDE